MKPPIFSCDWSRWGLGFEVVRVPSPWGLAGATRWSFCARLGPLGLDWIKTFYKEEN